MSTVPIIPLSEALDLDSYKYTCQAYQISEGWFTLFESDDLETTLEKAERFARHTSGVRILDNTK